MKKFLVLAIVVGLGIATTAQTGRAAIVVSTELALLVDVSGSVDSTEFNLQKSGYVQAFQSAAVQNLITNTPGGIAVMLGYWSGGLQQQVAVNWTHLTNAADANAFAAAIAATTRPYSGQTAPGSAINWAVPLFASNNFTSNRMVIDVSGDGDQNDGANTLTASTNAFNTGFTLNGLPIGPVSLANWYQANIVTPGGGFMVPAATFTDFKDAIETKLYREINNAVPEPATMAVFGVGALVAGGMYRRNRKTLAA